MKSPSPDAAPASNADATTPSSDTPTVATVEDLQVENAALKVQLATRTDDSEVERLMASTGMTRGQVISNLRRKAEFTQLRASQRGLSEMEIVKANANR